ncbi:MAG TPA: sigma-70 family RNA polymerase sigma factor [Pirellulales bacterium]|jgi:RNA polymerase sigma-70 factor (ECF subfamily)
MPIAESDQLLVERVRAGVPEAWQELIARYEGRLLAFVESRLACTAAAEDVVQETFLGFLTSLPNYDERRPLEGYLFSIAAHKLTDHLRREGRRPALPLSVTNSSGQWQPVAGGRGASSLVRSGERRDLEETALVAALAEQIDRLRGRDEWRQLACLELLFVRGWPNQQVAAALGLSQQAVANTKSEFLERLRSLVRRQQPHPDLFPELDSQ